MDNVKAKTLKENKNKNENRIQVYYLWRSTQITTQSGLLHKPHHDARPRPGDAQSTMIAFLA